jgi:3-oxoacyl-[acyl-carrier protein] reductase
MDIRGKTVLVTGGANGIGLSFVDRASGLDGRVCVIDRDRDALERLAAKYPSVSIFEADVSDYKQVTKAVKAIVDRFGTIDVLVNNAGVLLDFPLVTFSPALRERNLQWWHEVTGTNLNGVYYVTSLVAENMVRQRVKGVIVNISSVSSSGNRGQSAYAAAKSGVNALTKTWASELAPFGIRVAGIAPGFINTSMFLDSMNEGLRGKLLSKVLLGKAGEPEHIASAILFLIENDYITATTIEIDGGTEL